MTDGDHYDDGRAVLDDSGLILRRYYFPLGTSKHIPYGRIRSAGARPMGWLTGRGRVWGTGNLGYWAPLDVGRPGRSALVVLDLGTGVKPVFSPDDPEAVLRVLRGHGVQVEGCAATD